VKKKYLRKFSKLEIGDAVGMLVDPTLGPLVRAGLVAIQYDDFAHDWQFKLTDRGIKEIPGLLKSKGLPE